MEKSRVGGFTLVELLVCVSIVALLTMLAVPRVAAAMNTSRRARAEVELKQIHEALVRFYLDSGHYPRKLGDLTPDYLKDGTSFRSPVNGKWYFYAIDDGRSGNHPRAFILGLPEAEWELKNATLHRSGPLPRGANPEYRAPAWLHYSSGGLQLYAEDDSTELGGSTPVPENLDSYRTSCRPGSTSKCDVYTN